MKNSKVQTSEFRASVACEIAFLQLMFKEIGEAFVFLCLVFVLIFCCLNLNIPLFLYSLISVLFDFKIFNKT